MSNFLTQEQKVELEKMIDSATLEAVVIALAEIAAEKAQHIREAWQDNATAKPWDTYSVALDRLASRITV